MSPTSNPVTFSPNSNVYVILAAFVIGEVFAVISSGVTNESPGIGIAAGVTVIFPFASTATA